MKKSVYGLKQSSRAWFEHFGKVVSSYGFVQSQADRTLFYKHSKNNKISILIVYMDDIIQILTSDDEASLADLKKKLVLEFQIEDLWVLKYFL